MTGYDAIVVGLGGMGSAATYHLARRGLRVLGLEGRGIPHEWGSSHGITRIIRLAYYEDPAYVPLLRRAYELWRELEEAAGERLLVTTGSVDVSRRDDPVFSGSLRSCRAHAIPHEILDHAALAERFPAYHFPDGYFALYQADGGFLLPERCIVAHTQVAHGAGAELHGREPIRSWRADSGGVAVTTDRETYRAGQLVLCAGAWAGSLVPELAGRAVPERQVLLWLQPVRPALFHPERFPVCNMSAPEGHFYATPVYGIPGFKIGRYHHLGERVDPDTVDRETHARDEAPLRACLERYFPQAAGPVLSSRVCLFTNTADEHFILDRHPKHENVVIAAGFSGHGFKFSSVVGEIAAELASEGSSRHDLALFRIERLL